MRDAVSGVYRYVFPYLCQHFRPFLVLKIRWHYPLNLLNSVPSSNLSTTSFPADTKTSTPQSIQCRLLLSPVSTCPPPPAAPPAHSSPVSPAPHASAPCYRRSRPHTPPPAPTWHWCFCGSSRGTGRESWRQAHHGVRRAMACMIGEPRKEAGRGGMTRMWRGRGGCGA